MQALLSGLHRLVCVGVEFQAYVALISTLCDCRKDPLKINGTETRDKVVMATGMVNIFNMDMSDPGQKPLKGVTYVFTGAEEMPDIEIEPEIL